MSLSQIELVWVRVRVEGESLWVNLREDNKVSESKMPEAESKMAEFKMATIIKLSQNEWMKVFLSTDGQSGSVSEGFWVNLREENKVSESNHDSVWIQDGRIQDGCHLQVQVRMKDEVWIKMN